MEREVEHWCAHRDERILLVLTDGELVWDDDVQDFSTERSSAIPAVLRGRFAAEPRHLDLRWRRGDEVQLDLRHPRFREAVTDLAAPIHGVPKDELENEDVRRQRRALRLARGAAAALAVLVVTAVVAASLAVAGQRSALREARAADAGRLAALAQARASSDLPVALLLGVEAWRRLDVPETRGRSSGWGPPPRD